VSNAKAVSDVVADRASEEVRALEDRCHPHAGGTVHRRHGVISQEHSPGVRPEQQPEHLKECGLPRPAGAEQAQGSPRLGRYAQNSQMEAAAPDKLDPLTDER
jgi:hypothetical protein